MLAPRLPSQPASSVEPGRYALSQLAPARRLKTLLHKSMHACSKPYHIQWSHPFRAALAHNCNTYYSTRSKLPFRGNEGDGWIVADSTATACRRAAAPRWFWLLTNVATNGDRARARRGARCTRWRRATARSRRRSGARRRRTPGSRSWGAGSPAPACCTWAGRGAATPGWSTPTATSAASSCPRDGATGATSLEQSEQRFASSLLL